MYKDLQKFGSVKSNEPMAKHTTFKIGGPAEFFVTVEETAKLIDLVRWLDDQGIPRFVLGGGSNMLASDDGFKGVVINIKTQKSKVTGTTIFAEAGCITVAIAQLSMQSKLSGFEWGVGVPGTIGGATRGNAGAMGGETKDSVKTVTVLRDGEVVELVNAECRFGYRDSIFKHNDDIVLSVTLQLAEAKNSNSMKQALEYLQYRNKTQPQGFASTGCIFQNIQVNKISSKIKDQLLAQFPDDLEKIEQFFKLGKISAGWLVEKAGIKGRQVGQVKVSETHGNFVVNLGGATAHDVLTLIEQIKEKVYTETGVTIEEEIQLL